VGVAATGESVARDVLVSLDVGVVDEEEGVVDEEEGVVEEEEGAGIVDTKEDEEGFRSNVVEVDEAEEEPVPSGSAGRGCGMTGVSSDKVQFLTISTADSPLSRVIGVIWIMHSSITGPMDVLLV